jgi:cell division protein FtsQ
MAVLTAAAAFPQSALFAVDQIVVTGARRLSPGTVAAIAGIRRGERLFAIDASAAERRLLADPRIKAARVEIRPPRAVVLRITERIPVVALAVREGFALLGDDLVVVAVEADAAGLPEVREARGLLRWARPGVPVVSEAASTAVAALAAAPPAVRADVVRISVTAGGDIAFLLRGGITVRAGPLSGLADRLAHVPAVLEALRSRDVAASAIDLRHAGSIAVTLARGGEGR